MKTNKIKIFTLSLITSITTLTKASDCNPNAIIYRSGTSNGISFGGNEGGFNGSNQSSINMPVETKQGWGCYKKQSGISVEIEKNDSGVLQEIIISPMQASFENLPNARVSQYLYYDENPEMLYKSRYTISAFICVEDKLVSIENRRFTLIDLLTQSQKNQVHISTSFATGEAAKNLGAKAASSTEHTLFYALALQKGFKPSAKCTNCEDIRVPSLFHDSQTKTLGDIAVSLSDYYSTLDQKLPFNPCDSEFEKLLLDYRVENYKQNESLQSLVVKKKWFSDKLILKPKK